MEADLKGARAGDRSIPLFLSSRKFKKNKDGMRRGRPEDQTEYSMLQSGQTKGARLNLDEAIAEKNAEA